MRGFRELQMAAKEGGFLDVNDSLYDGDSSADTACS